MSPMLLFVLCLLPVQGSADSSEQWSAESPARVAVIGAGIGGASLALFLSELTNNSVDITVFEASDRVGGRIHSVDVAGSLVEAGAGIGVLPNKYLVDLVKRGGLERQSPKSIEGSFGVWDGSSMLVTLQGWTQMLTLLFRYGLSMPVVAQLSVLPAVEKFGQIYDVQNVEKKAFRDVEALWKHLGLYDYTQTTLERALLDPWTSFFGVNVTQATQRFVDEFVAGITRINYNQSPKTMNALAGLIGLTPFVSDSIFSVRGGNQKVVSRTLERSGAKVRRGCRVQKVSSMASGSGYTLTTKGTCEGPNRFDTVVFATPLENAGIEIEAEGLPVFPERSFQNTISTFVSGHLKPEYFGVDCISDIPAMLATVELEGIPFSSISSISGTADGARLVKFFSRHPLSEEVLGSIFEPGYRVHAVYPWDAYVKFSPPEKFTRFQIGDRLYYINAIETGASAMEISAVGAKNVALLVAEDLGLTNAVPRSSSGSPDDERVEEDVKNEL